MITAFEELHVQAENSRLEMHFKCKDPITFYIILLLSIFLLDSVNIFVPSAQCLNYFKFCIICGFVTPSVCGMWQTIDKC